MHPRGFFANVKHALNISHGKKVVFFINTLSHTVHTQKEYFTKAKPSFKMRSREILNAAVAQRLTFT